MVDSDDPRSTTTVVPDPPRWRALGVIAIAQLMVVLDASIVNLALPSAKASLKISDANQQWVITAYTLTFGGVLLLGGVLTEYLSWRWCLLVNAPIAMSAVLMAVPWVHESRAERDTRYDVAHSVPRWGS